MRKVLLLLAAVAAGHAQSFEVVSIKPAPPPDPGAGMSVSSRGGPGSGNPGMWTCTNMSLAGIVTNAFDLRANELSAPDWMDRERFNITAKIAEGTTREQFRLMMQNMLAERFGLKVHREKREVQGYELVVAKGGPKFKESVPEPPKDPAADQPKSGPPRPMSLGADGFPVLGQGMQMAIMRGRARAQYPNATIDHFARNLAYQVAKPVVNATGLTGKYDLALYWATESMNAAVAPPPCGEAAPVASEPAGPTLFTALQEQLGLKLEPKKVTIEVLVVDHAEKLPTEN